MLKLILGPAGSGKSRLLYEQISALSKEGKQSLLIVPDSMSHLAERRLLLHCGNGVSHYARVCSLSRLADDILSACGDKTQYLDGGGRVLSMYRAISSLQGRLRYFDSTLQRPALVSAMLDTVNEFVFSGVSENHPALWNNDLSAKMQDIRDIYIAYMDICRASSLDPALMLNKAREKMAESKLLCDKYVFFDDFSAYSEQKMRFIEGILENSLCCTFALMTNGDRVTFCEAHKTADRLTETVSKKGQKAEVITLPFSRAQRSAQLNALEELFSADKHPCTEPGGDDVQLFCAKNESEECELAAALVRRLTVRDGARLRDIAVVCGEEEAYRGLMEGAFIRYGIPCFFSRREEVLKKPVFSFALGALLCLSDGMRLESVLSYLKCCIGTHSQDDLCKIENYALLWGISGNAWFEPFYKPTCGFTHPYSDEQERLAHLESLRSRLMKPIDDLRQTMRGTQKGEQLVDAFFEHIQSINLKQIISLRIDALLKSDRTQQAQEYAQLYDILTSALNQLKAVCGDIDMDIREFCRLLRLTLSQYDVSSIPSSLDSVTFGPFSRLSPFGIKHLIVLGARAGALPPDAPSGSIIGESERDALEKKGIFLPRSETKALSQQSDVYRAFNAPDKTLAVIWPRTGSDGSAYQKSYVVSYMQKLLPEVKEQAADELLRKLRLIAPSPAFELACSAGAADAEECAEAAFAYLSEDADTAKKLGLARSFGIEKSRKITSKDTLKKLYGKHLSVSASAIEKFYTCRFSYFCQFGLRAQERKAAALGAPEVGTMVHSVVENAIKALSQGTESTPADAAARFTKEYSSSLRGADTPRMQALIRQVQNNAAIIINDVWEEIKNSDFKPAYFELNFAFNGDKDPFVWEKDGLSFALRGKIDRVDRWGDKLKVVDYKTGNKKYSLSDILIGKNLQPFIYMLMLQKADMGENCAALFLPAKADYIESDEPLSDALLEDKRAKNVRRMGLVRCETDVLQALEHTSPGSPMRWLPVTYKKDGSIDTKKSSVASKDQMDRIISYTEQKVMEFSAAVASGDITVAPYAEDACKYCAFKAACFMEDEMPNDTNTATNNTEQVLAVIDGEEEPNGCI